MAFSDNLTAYTGELSRSIQEAIAEIQSFFPSSTMRVLKYDDNHIAIPITFQVPVPPRGAVGGIDIREHEAMLLLISTNHYPAQIPVLASDREDFPKKNLPHLYVSHKDKPARLCLVRSSPHEWFASRRISDLLEVGHQWLFKAVTGSLVEDGEEFDPLRLDDCYGSHSYSYDVLYNIISSNTRFHPDYSMAALLTFRPSETSTLKSISAIPPIMVGRIIDAERKAGEGANNKQPHQPFFSLLVWNENGTTSDEYNTELPSNFAELVEYFEKYGIDITAHINVFLAAGMVLRNGIPIIHAIRRPRKLIGYAGDYEFINFTASTNASGLFSNDAEVNYQMHVEPFSSVIASKLTGENRNKGILFIGAGSLGSKIIYHEARSGNKNLGIVDHDTFLHHNLARHVLGATRIGQNKATAIVDEITTWYDLDIRREFVAYPDQIENIDPSITNKYPWIIDTTASTMVQNWISLTSLPLSTKVARCELADDGNLGLLYIEGEGRNPRIDDLINFTYYQGKENIHVRKWRLKDAQREPTTVDIGLGCSSTTSIISDDTISIHAALFSKVMYKERESESASKDGLVYLNMLGDPTTPKLKNESIRIKPFSTFLCAEGSGWEIRLAHGLQKQFISLCRGKKKTETGGILIGVSNYKTKTIHIFEIIKEPRDSKGTCTGFTRGISGLPQQVDKIKRNTGGVIGYVGEWHTHPMDLEDLSGRDRETISELQTMNRKTPIPTLAIIVTNTKIVPFVFQ